MLVRRVGKGNLAWYQRVSNLVSKGKNNISALKVHSLLSIKDLRIIGSVRCILLELDLFFVQR